MTSRGPAADPFDRDFPPLSFDMLEGWEDDDHLAAFRAFLKSCEHDALSDLEKASFPREEALALGPDIGKDAAREFFETHFTPRCRYDSRLDDGFVTGYYEPMVRGARERSAQYCVPVYGRPDDLVMLSDDLYRAAANDRVSARRDCGDALEDYFTRAQIEDGALKDRGLEALYLDDWIETFFMHVQGSGLVQLDDGTEVRLAYDGKNGHPYTSIARQLVDRREVLPKDIDMEKVKAWLRADPERGRALMQENQSYIFFRELERDEGRDGPLGAEGVPLTAGRSLAVDPVYTPLGCPVYLLAANLPSERGPEFARLMIAQDVGSAIRGPERGDIFWGSGEAAGAIAGTTRHLAVFIFLLPNP
ncbi:murein transglycosylase A [Methyloceanibacter sp.]|uniref:murein transglycosylase A n=1 Tax=Methyloceanibacter sp. TaxID=1965321 RepID=UPI003567AA1D